MRAMLTLVFVFMLFNLTSFWNLPTISIGERGPDGIPSLIGHRDWFFIRGCAWKAAPQGIPDGGSHPRFYAMLRRSAR